MRVVSLPEILAVLDEAEAERLVGEGFRRFSAGQCQVMAVGELLFDAPPGDCHVKGGHLQGDEHFVVKCATTFYQNPAVGLPSAGGFVALVSARTGEVAAILHDQGRLTDIRTAIAGALAARAVSHPGIRSLGVVGAGMQARLQARRISRALQIREVMVWGRDPSKAAALARELGGEAPGVEALSAEALGLEALCRRADLIVTTTPSTEVLVQADWVRPGTRIIAVGADGAGKRELDPRLLADAVLIADSRSQCLDHGEIGWAVRAGLAQSEAVIELGELLAEPRPFPKDRTVVVDLTGVGVQDVQIAKAVWRALAAQTA